MKELMLIVVTLCFTWAAIIYVQYKNGGNKEPK